MRHSENIDRAMAVLDDIERLQGKLPVEKIRDELKAAGCISLKTLNEQELDIAREFVRIYRERLVRVGDVQMEFVSLTEEVKDDEGEPVQIDYYKRHGELTKQEGVQLLTKQQKRCKKEVDKFYRYADPLLERYGAEFKQMLPFALPRRLKEVVTS